MATPSWASEFGGQLPSPSASHRRSRAARVQLWVLKNRPLSYWIIALGALAAFDVFRFFTSVSAPVPAPAPEQHNDQWPVDPLVNYQALNKLPMVQPYQKTTKKERAVVTTMYTDTFAHGVATLGHSIRAVDTDARLILAYFANKVSSRALCIAKAGGWELQPIERIPPPHGGKDIHYTFVDQYSKLSIWSFDTLGIKSLVYMDADTLVRHNFDELWDLPYTFAAGPDVWTNERGFVIGFNAGVMLLRPDSRVFHDLVAKMEVADFPLNWAEQAYLNQYFGGHALRLPFIYNGNVAIKEKSPKLWKAMEKDLRVVHYTLAKPFPPYDGGLIEAEKLKEHLTREKQGNSRYTQELTWWEQSWDAMRADKATALAACPAF